MFLTAAQTYQYTTQTSDLSSGAWVGIGLAALVLAVLIIAGMWKTFVKAGRPGWAAIIPFYNLWVEAEIAGKPGWWGLLTLVAFVPFVGWIGALYVGIVLALGMARNFGKSGFFGVVGLFLFGFIGYLILGFGDAKYQPVTEGQHGTTPEPPYPTTSA